LIDKTLTPTVSAVADITSGKIDLGDIRHYSVQAVISGSDVAGTFKLQKSNDGVNFNDIVNASVAVTNSADVFIDVPTATNAAGIPEASYRYMRYYWDYTSGTGNITVTFCGKSRLPKTNLR